MFGNRFRRVLLLLLLSLSFSVAHGATPLTKQHVDAFLSRPLYVVLDNNPMSDWNMKLADAVKEFWTLTEYHFINDTQYEQMKFDEDKAFLVRLRVSFPGDPMKSEYNFMCFTIGYKTRRESDIPTICYIPLGYRKVDMLSWTYKLPSFLRFAQKHIELIHGRPELIRSDNPFEHYNKNLPSLGSKEVWMIREDIAPDMRSESAIRKYYTGRFRLVTKDDIEQAINDKRDDVVYLHKVGPEGTDNRARIYKVLIGAGDDRVYYFDYHMVSSRKPDGFLKSDFRRIGRD